MRDRDEVVLTKFLFLAVMLIGNRASANSSCLYKAVNNEALYQGRDSHMKCESKDAPKDEPSVKIRILKF